MVVTVKLSSISLLVNTFSVHVICALTESIFLPFVTEGNTYLNEITRTKHGH